MDSHERAALLAEFRAELDEAARELRTGADAVHLVEPAAAREPIRWILLAAAEQCGRARHILGLSVTHQLALARALIDVGGQHDPHP